MRTIYQAVYRCKAKEEVGVPGYYDVRLGLVGVNGTSDVIVNGTCADFEVGVEYLIGIARKEE